MDLTPLYLSAKLSMISTALLLVLALPLCCLLVFGRFRGKFLLDALVSLPLVLPPTVLGFYLLIIMGPQGIGTLWEKATGWQLVFSFAGIVIAAMVHSLPFAVQPLKASFEKIDTRLLEMSEVLGCSPVATFFRVIIPNSLNGIAASAILTFAHTMGEFGVILMIGGSIPGSTKVASVAIYEHVESMQYSEAAILSLFLVGASYAMLLVINYLNQRTHYGT
ncbi:MAG: molybdate ABC transporter permease subunit [Desulfobulbaceae bacterium]|uniref:Molybdenum transport system permease n=1 Tax=Candidatus Desulfobia pelagia TaxID=2841692 RepID=A0A8J6NGC9_9BACT|nr:molybdate ABC transporter permease subunit [Candidatus Desulfobia pelagia]